MIDLNKAKDEFMNYTAGFDLKHPKINMKIYHSLRVEACSDKIAKSINLSGEELELAKLIGLLHDIARFEQMKKYNTFSDKLSVDHGDLGVQILEKNNFIRRFIDTDKYDKIIKLAIKNHNKYSIQEGLTEKELLYSKIIRDADKLDIFYEATAMFWENPDVVEKIENSYISNSYLEQFLNHKQIVKQPIQSEIDRVIVVLSFIYDINFKYTIEYILNEKYIDIIFDKFNFKNEKTINQIKLIKQTIYEYLKK